VSDASVALGGGPDRYDSCNLEPHSVVPHEQLARLRREAQSELTQILMQAPVAMCVLSAPDLVYEMANPLYLRMVGRDDVIGRTIRQVLPELSDDAPVLSRPTSTSSASTAAATGRWKTRSSSSGCSR
jgi:hypothetical protein